MKHEDKTKEQLIDELVELHQRVAKLEAESTERMGPEESLHLAHQKLRATFDAIQDNVNVVDLDFNLTDVNDALVRAFDLPDRESVLGRKCFEALKGRQYLCPGCVVAEAYRTKAPAYRTSTPEDEASTGGRSFEIFAYPIIDEQGNLAGAVEFARDVTQRKTAAEALREGEEKYRTLVEQSLQGLIVIQDSRIVFANTAFAEISGYTIEELMSLSPQGVRAVVHPEDQGLVWGRLRDRLAEQAAPPRYEYRGIRKGGVVRWLEMFASRIEYGGKPAIQGAIVDITERKRAVRALERLATQLATVGEIGRQIASILDPDELLRQIVNLLEDAFGYLFVYIFLLEEDSSELMLRAGAGATGRTLEGARIAIAARSINTYVARTGEPLLVNDISKEPTYLLLAGVADTKSELTVPIKVKDQVIGTLDVQSTKLNAFDESDLFTLQALASQTGIAIENARLYEEAQQRIEEMTSVYNISVATTSTLSLDEVLKSVCEQVSRLMGVSSFYIALYDAAKEELRFELALDEGVRVEKFARKTTNGGGLSGWIVQSREPLLVRDMEREELPIEAILVGEPARSWLGVPLSYRDRLVGVMGVQSYQPNAFDEDDQRLLSTIAAQVAIAIENARLFVETNGRAKDLALLLGASTAISSTLDPDQILETVAQQITTSLVATFCRITLLDEAGENLAIHAVSPIRDSKAENGFERRCPLGIVPWHRQVIETGQPVVLRQDVPGLALSDEERKLVLTEEVKSAALVPLIVGGRVLGVISMGEERGWERSPFTPEKVALCQSIAAQAAVAIENARLYEELQQSFVQTIAALAAAVDAKDPYTGGHSQRTTELAAAIAQELGLDDKEIELLRYACLLHDVGKIGISEQILGKPGPLSEEEWEIIRRHPTLGAGIVERAASLYELVPIILHHHEHYDGQGYPEGLRGEDIPLKARILSVADAYEAMTSDRAYRPAMSMQEALATLRQGAGEQWDDKVVNALCRIIREQDHCEEVGK